MKMGTHSIAGSARLALRLAVLFAMVPLLNACEVQRTPRAQVLNPDSARASEIEVALAGYTAAVIQRDARRSASYFTPDARLYSPGSPDLVGSDMIRGTLVHTLESAEVTALTMEREIIDIAGDSTAYEVGTFSRSYREDGADEQTVNGTYMIRWRLEPQATWRIHTMLLQHASAEAADTDTTGTVPARPTDR
ncbi:hypothetical protein BH23GEM10_BH23GEM10_07420 [soil metagenome]